MMKKILFLALLLGVCLGSISNESLGHRDRKRAGDRGAFLQSGGAAGFRRDACECAKPNPRRGCAGHPNGSPVTQPGFQDRRGHRTVDRSAPGLSYPSGRGRDRIAGKNTKRWGP